MHKWCINIWRAKAGEQNSHLHERSGSSQTDTARTTAAHFLQYQWRARVHMNHSSAAAHAAVLQLPF